MSSISDLKFDDKNFNKHTEYGMSLLEKSLKENGAGRSILIDKDNNIIAGNGIIEAAGQAGFEKVKIVETTGDEIIAVKRTDLKLDSKKGREMALADNATASIDLDWNDDLISEEADKWGFDASDWLGNDWKDEPEEVVEDEAPEVDESEPAKSELGKVYQLGEHRLMCDDSTDAGSVAILMDGRKADMVFTDPPYGMYLDTKMSAQKREKGGWTSKPKNYGKVIGDNEDFSAKLIETIFDNFKYCKEIFIWGADYFAELIPQRTEGAWFVWDKRAGIENVEFTLSEFELLWSRQKHQRRIARVRWMGLLGTEQEPDHRRFHPTQKPIELSKWFIEKYSKKDQTIVDLFGGSGSTLIACEQLGRKCYMMELDPKYCDVIRKRYWKFVNGSEEGWEDGTRAIC